MVHIFFCWMCKEISEFSLAQFIVTDTEVWHLWHNVFGAGKDCDILVHEATHEDNLEEEAHQKRHRCVKVHGY